MWTYIQSTGELLRNGVHADTGYSGYSAGKNNPAAQAIEEVGPIPAGRWLITALEMTTPAHGPYVLVLAPAKGTNTFGRTDFRIHGDSIAAPGEASRGCIILCRATRELIWNSGDRVLTVE